MSGIPVVKESRSYPTCAIALQRQELPSDKISFGFLDNNIYGFFTGKCRASGSTNFNRQWDDLVGRERLELPTSSV